MKRCNMCKEEKPFEEFNKAGKQGFGSYCRPCCKVYRKKHYTENLAYHKDRHKVYRDRNRDLLYEYLRTHPCVDCGESDLVVLQFDHKVSSEKSHNVSMMPGSSSWESILVEIAKCDVRCANCHMRKTAKQQGWRR